MRIKYLQFFQVNQNVFIKTRKSESSIVNEFALINRTLFRLLTLFGALAPMTITHPSVGWPAKIATFLATSLCSSALIRLVARTYDSAFSIPVGVVALLTGIVIAWFALRRWRRVAPLHRFDHASGIDTVRKTPGCQPSTSPRFLGVIRNSAAKSQFCRAVIRSRHHQKQFAGRERCAASSS